MKVVKGNRAQIFLGITRDNSNYLEGIIEQWDGKIMPIKMKGTKKGMFLSLAGMCLSENRLDKETIFSFINSCIKNKAVSSQEIDLFLKQRNLNGG